MPVVAVEAEVTDVPVVAVVAEVQCSAVVAVVDVVPVVYSYSSSSCCSISSSCSG